MSRRRRASAWLDETVPCPGSGHRAVSVYADAGICAACGVRTFIDRGGRIAEHVTTRAEVEMYQRLRGRTAQPPWRPR